MFLDDTFVCMYLIVSLEGSIWAFVMQDKMTGINDSFKKKAAKFVAVEFSVILRASQQWYIQGTDGQCTDCHQLCQGLPI